MVIEVPELVRLKALGQGAVGEAWLSSLPEVVARLASEWSLTLGRSFAEGSGSYCVRAGSDAVIKVVAPGHDAAAQIRTLQAADGRGYVRLLASSGDALLLEALGEPLDLAPESCLPLVARLLRRAWLPPSEEPLANAEELAELVERLWHKHDRPCSREAYSQAMRYAERRSVPSAPPVLVHGDPHPGNVLQVPAPRSGTESGYVFIDPSGFVADPAYDLGIVLRDWCSELLAAPDPVALARRYCAVLAASSGFSATAIWEWGYIERVSTGLFLMDFAGPAGEPFLRTAELLVG